MGGDKGFSGSAPTHPLASSSDVLAASLTISSLQAWLSLFPPSVHSPCNASSTTLPSYLRSVTCPTLLFNFSFLTHFGFRVHSDSHCVASFHHRSQDPAFWLHLFEVSGLSQFQKLNSDDSKCIRHHPQHATHGFHGSVWSATKKQTAVLWGRNQ